jgi:hypothetical protein
MKTTQEIAQWVIDNRYPKSENNKVSDAEMYHTLIEAMNQVLQQPLVSSSLLSDVDYWKQRCLLAEKCLEESPCDPDITSDQRKAWNAYHMFISWAGNDR